VNCICPGYIDAGLAEGYFQAQPDPAAARKAAVKLHALGRIGRPEEVARVAAFLASDEASFMTGSAVPVDFAARVAKNKSPEVVVEPIRLGQ
jgi:NAD(P)-dependent dehydrogenase (short-subunit alcohol dehydrogenase family)